MNSDEIFKIFPDLVFSTFRNQMLLGKVPAETVKRVLEPLLTNFHELMLRLPVELQTDFENILRIYPDVGEGFGIRIKPAISGALRRLARYWFETGSADQSDQELDIAAESQQKFDKAGKPFNGEGQGFFKTDKEKPVFIQFSYPEEDEGVVFEYHPPKFDIKVYICGTYAMSLTATEPRQRISASVLSEILAQCAGEVEIEVFEIEPGKASA